MGRQAPFWPQHPCCSHLHAYNACSLCSLWLRPFRLSFLFSALSCLLTWRDTILSLESLDLLLLGWTSLSTLMSIWPHFLKYFFLCFTLSSVFLYPFVPPPVSEHRAFLLQPKTRSCLMSSVHCPSSLCMLSFPLFHLVSLLCPQESFDLPVFHSLITHLLFFLCLGWDWFPQIHCHVLIAKPKGPCSQLAFRHHSCSLLLTPAFVS